MALVMREQQKIIELLSGFYEQIRTLELNLGLQVGKGDYRPRIEYFHDAVRALTRNKNEDRETGGRLAIEFISYDMAALRYIQSMPMSQLNPGHHHLSPHTDIARKGNVPPHPPRAAVRADKQQLAELYRQYAVLFAALLKPAADDDYRDRIEEMDELASQVAAILAQAEALGQGKGSVEALKNAILHCEDKTARAHGEALLKSNAYKNAAHLGAGLKNLKSIIAQTDQRIAGIEAAHMQYSTAQLGVYEKAKDVVKRLAGEGLNLAGQFVESAVIQERGGRER